MENDLFSHVSPHHASRWPSQHRVSECLWQRSSETTQEKERASNFVTQTDTVTDIHLFSSLFSSIWQVFSLKESFQTVGTQGKLAVRGQAKYQTNNPSAAQEKVYFTFKLIFLILERNILFVYVFDHFPFKVQRDAVKTEVSFPLGC